MHLMAEPSPASQPAAGAERPRRRFLGGLGAALALALAGCAGVVPKPAAPPPAPPPPPVQTGSLPLDQARHRVALLVPMSGSNAAVGQSIANAANLAILDTGVAKVRVTVYDTSLGAEVAAKKALADGNQLFLGPLLAEDVRAVAPVAQSGRVPVIAFSNDASVAGNGTYLLGFTPAGAVERVVDYAAGRGVKRFAGLMPSGLYGRRASTVLIKAAENAGGQVVAMESYDRSPQSLTMAVRKLGPPGAYDAVLVADSGRMMLAASPLIRKAGGANAHILGTELWNTEPSLGASPAMRGAWFASVSDGMYHQFATKYRARFGRGPYRLASLGYDAVLLVVRVAGGWELDAPFPIARLTDAGGFSGVDGAFRFGRDGVAQRALEVKQVGPGGFTVVSAAPRGF